MPENCSTGDCPVTARVDALEKEFDRYRTSSSDTHRQMFDRLGALEQARASTETMLEGIDAKLDELTATAKALAEKPGKRWDSLVEKAIWAVAAAVIAFFLARAGL